MKALVVGGNSGLGLAMVLELIDRGYSKIYIVGKEYPKDEDIGEDVLNKFKKICKPIKANLIDCDYSIFNEINDIDTLIYTAGFGRVSLFEDLNVREIENIIKLNQLSAIKVIKKYYNQIKSHKEFYCAVIGSIAGHVASPLFSVYGSSKFGLCSFIENVNIELIVSGIENRILDVSPGSLKGTSFNGGKNDVSLLKETTATIYDKMLNRELLYIPMYDEVYKKVIERYKKDNIEFGLSSYEYKTSQNRISTKPQVVLGYLSGTFDLFHIGHLNLLERAKAQCDYLIVGVHESGAWKGKETYIPFEERKRIVGACRYVDEVITSLPEDSDAYDIYKVNKIFVGSDYKGSERFNKYEEYLKDKEVEIVYFPYTEGTSSTQLREKLK